MVKDTCFRCKRPVYPTDKMGPLKDGAFFHNGCFKCYICGTRLSLKTYCNNRNDTNDQEVYCSSHVPLAGPHEPIPNRSNLLNNISANGNGYKSGLHSPDSRNGDISPNASGSSSGHGAGDRSAVSGGSGPAGGIVWDQKIAHALKATAVQKPYPKINFEGAKYVLDYDTQTRLELVHRKEEDDFYNALVQQRKDEENQFSHETKEEWEKALADLARKYDRASQRGSKARDDLLRQLTLKREKGIMHKLQRETMHTRRKERERLLTAELVDKQAREMMDLFKEARQEKQKESKIIRIQQHHEDNNNSRGTTQQSSQILTNGSGENGHFYRAKLANGVVSESGSVNGSTSELANGEVEYPTTPPPPFPPIGRKRDVYRDTAAFELVDQTAISVAQSEQRTWTDLIRALTANCKNDIEKARAIYRWITVKNLNLMEFDVMADSNTPMGLLRGIKYGTESYHVLFKRLCSHQTFEMSPTKDAPPSHGHVSSSNHRSIDNLRYEYDDHYFMTDPEEFIYEFYPNQPEWQLLRRPIGLGDFENLPFVRSLFFRYGLNFADPQIRSGVFADKTGAATVAINMSPEAIRDHFLYYVIFSGIRKGAVDRDFIGQCNRL